MNGNGHTRRTLVLVMSALFTTLVGGYVFFPVSGEGQSAPDREAPDRAVASRDTADAAAATPVDEGAKGGGKGCVPCGDICRGKPKCLRVWERKSDDPGLGVENRPGFEQTFDGERVCLKSTTVKMNSRGFRDVEHVLEKAHNTFRVAVIGDATAFGWGVEPEEAFPKALETVLEANNGGWTYEVFNLSVCGYGMAEKVAVFKKDGLPFDPDVVVLQVSPDDHILSSESADPDRSRSVPTEADWKAVKAALLDLANITLTRKVDVVLFLPRAPPSRFPLKELANRFRWKVVDAFPDPKVEARFRLCDGDGHPNAALHRVYAERLFQTLAENEWLPIERAFDCDILREDIKPHCEYCEKVRHSGVDIINCTAERIVNVGKDLETGVKVCKLMELTGMDDLYMCYAGVYRWVDLEVALENCSLVASLERYFCRALTLRDMGRVKEGLAECEMLVGAETADPRVDGEDRSNMCKALLYKDPKYCGRIKSVAGEGSKTDCYVTLGNDLFLSGSEE